MLSRSWGSFLIYAMGVGSLFAADVIITAFFDPASIALWAESRSLIGVSGIVCLVGLDQVLVRSPQSSTRLLKTLAVQVPVIAVPVGIGVWALGFLSSWAVAAAIAVGSAGLTALFQYFRSHHRRTQAQLAHQSWKTVALLLVVVVLGAGVDIQLDTMLSVALIAMLGLHAVALLINSRPSTMHPQAPEPAHALYSIGSRFMATSLMLALAVYGEQLVVNGLGTAGEAATYFTHATYFLFPSSVLISFLGFLAGPWMRDHHDQYVALLQKRTRGIILGCLAYALLMNLVGWSGWQIVNPASGPPDPVLQLLFLLSAFANALYVQPSSYTGIFGAPRQHDVLIVGQILILGCVLALFISLQASTFPLVYATAFASGLNRLLRTLLGFGVTYAIIRSRTES